MAKTNYEVKIYMKHRTTHTQEAAAAKAGMTAKTARKYEQSGKLPGETKKPRDYKTRADPFEKHTKYIEDMYIAAPRLHAKTILKHLISTFPEANYKPSQLRTLSRRLSPLRVLHGKPKEVFFPQELHPGIESQSDWTFMNDLNITIVGQHLKHNLFHFMLPYSCWESIDICYSESFDSLARGYNKAVTELGGVTPFHKTDNSSTATKKAPAGRAYTGRYAGLLEHYDVVARRNNPGKGNENGSVEKSHDLFKIAVDQALLIRGSREFATLEDYQRFLEALVKERNLERVAKLGEERKLFKPLPAKPYEYLELKEVRVNKFGLIRVSGAAYSVPTQYIGSKLDAVISCSQITVYFEDHLVGIMPKAMDTPQINYLHVIDELIKKPGAFKNYKYRECLYPHPVYKQTCEVLESCSDAYAKDYLSVLHLAKHYGESAVTQLLQEHLSTGTVVEFIQSGALDKQIKASVAVSLPPTNEQLELPNVAAFDCLLPSRAGGV
jgi:transposase